LAGSACLWLLFGYTMLMIIRLTPLYEPLACHEGGSELGEMIAGEENINISGTSKKRCENFNAYPITVREGASGPVYWKNGTKLVEIGKNHLPTIVIPASGEAIGSTSMSFSLGVDLAMEIMENPVLQIVAKVMMVSEAEIRILGLPLKSEQPKEQFCGFEIRMAEQKVGHILCAETVESLYIQGVDNETDVVEYVHLDPAALNHEAMKKNIGLGLLLVVSCVLSLVTLAVGIKNMKEMQAREAKTMDV